MIPNMTKGSNFRGAYQYFCHDKKARTRERIDWTHTENMLTDNVDLAWKVMAYTAMEQDRLKEVAGHKRTGRKLKKPVIAYSLAWHPEENPDKDEMLRTAQKSMAALGLEDHEAIIVAHRDEPQKHVHLVINSVHPLTGLVADQSNSWRKLSAFALRYERGRGKIYCQQREANHQQKGKGMKHNFNITQAWENSDSGRSFQAALVERGYRLAQGRKGVVIVDAEGGVHRPARRIPDLRAKDVRDRLSDLDVSQLPDADQLKVEVASKKKTKAPLAKPQQPVAEQDNRPEVPMPKPLPQATSGHLNRLQSEHFDEYDRVSKRHFRRIDAELRRLTDYYDLKDKKQEINQLKKRVRKPSWWLRLTGQARRDRQDLSDCQKGYRNAQERMMERIDFLKQDRDQALDKLKERQAQEMKLLYEHGPEVLEAHRELNRQVKTQEPRIERSRSPGLRY